MRFHVLVSDTPAAQAAGAEVVSRYGSVPLEDADVVVVLGGDGFMLESLHALMGTRLPVYGVNLGTVGFLLNSYVPGGLPERVELASSTPLRPLRVDAWGEDGEFLGSMVAINDVSLVRASSQSAHLEVSVDGQVQIDRLVGDGCLVATSAGSTAYNLSAGGPIIPLGSSLVALTPICAASPRRWPGALLHAGTRVGLRVLQASKRPVSATADNFRFDRVGRVEVVEDPSLVLSVLFDPGHALEDRIVRQQFLP